MEESALAAGDAAELPSLTRPGALGLRAGTLTVPGQQTQIQPAPHRGELQEGDLGTQIDPQRLVQRQQPIVGKRKIPQEGRFRTRKVVGRDALPRLGGILPRLPAGAPLAHPDAMAPSRALKVEPGRVVGVSGDGGDQARQNGREYQPAEHWPTIGTHRISVGSAGDEAPVVWFAGVWERSDPAAGDVPPSRTRLVRSSCSGHRVRRWVRSSRPPRWQAAPRMTRRPAGDGVAGRQDHFSPTPFAGEGRRGRRKNPSQPALTGQRRSSTWRARSGQGAPTPAGRVLCPESTSTRSMGRSTNLGAGAGPFQLLFGGVGCLGVHGFQDRLGERVDQFLGLAEAQLGE